MIKIGNICITIASSMDIKIFQWFPNTRKLGNTQKKNLQKNPTKTPNSVHLRWIRRRCRDPLRLIRHFFGPKGLVPQPLVVESHSSLPNLGKLMPKFLSHQNAGGGHLLGWTRCECRVQGDRVSEKKLCVMQVTVRNILLSFRHHRTSPRKVGHSFSPPKKKIC